MERWGEGGGGGYSYFLFIAFARMQLFFNYLPLDFPYAHLHTPPQCTYHAKSPSFGEEFKIRLPLVIRPGHHLLFSLYHVHVKDKGDDDSLVAKLVGKQKEEAVEELIGHAALPLWRVHDAAIPGTSVRTVLPDGAFWLPLMPHGSVPEHYLSSPDFALAEAGPEGPVGASTVPAGVETSSSPGRAILVSTRLLSTVYPQDPAVVSFLSCIPASPALSLPDVVPQGEPTGSTEAAGGSSGPDRRGTLVTAVEHLKTASPAAVSRHLLVLVRQLTVSFYF